MRVASFLLPVLHPRGDKYDPTHQEARGTLLRAYGGYTASTVTGVWADPSTRKPCYDTCVRYEIARDWTARELNDLHRTIIHLGELSQQVCMYVQWPLGEVELLACDAHKHADAAISSSNTVAWIAAEAHKSQYGYRGITTTPKDILDAKAARSLPNAYAY
jgi:hypothetical protein